MLPIVGNVHVRPALYQKRHHLILSLTGGKEKGRGSLPVPAVEAGVGVNERSAQMQVSPACRKMQRGASVPQPLVHIRPCLHQNLGDQKIPPFAGQQKRRLPAVVGPVQLRRLHQLLHGLRPVVEAGLMKGGVSAAVRLSAGSPLKDIPQTPCRRIVCRPAALIVRGV